MKRISTATKVVDKFGAGKHGFTNGDVVGGIAATDLEADHFDHVQEEICAVIEDPAAVVAAGAVDGGSKIQLLTALKALFAKKVPAAEAMEGTAKVATQAQTDAGADDTTIVTPKKLRWGVSYLLAVTGYVVLPSWLGGIIIQWGATTTSATAGANTPATFPIAFPTAAWRVFGSNTSSSTSGTTVYAGAMTLTGFVAASSVALLGVAWLAIGK